MRVAARHDRPIIVLSAAAILLGVVLRLAGVFLIPFGQSVNLRLEGLNDEPAHFRYVEHLATRRTFPVQTHHVGEPGAFARADFEFYQPPLYYLVAGGLYLLAGPDAAPRLCRLLSCLCGIATLWVMWRIFRNCGLPQHAAMPGIAFASLFLTHAYFCALVSNDALSWLLGALILLTLTTRHGAPQRASSGAALRRGTLLATLLAAGVLTKSSLVAFFPVAVLAYAREAFRLRTSRPLVEGALVIIAAVLIAALWHARNLQLYGTLFALDVGFGPQPHPPPSAAGLYGLVVNTIKYFWFPMQHLEPSLWVRGLRAVGIVLAAGHGALALAHAWRRRSLPAQETYLAASLLSVLAVYLLLNLRWSEPEGRFLLPAFVPIVYAFAAGVWGIVGGTKWAAVGAIELLVAALFPYLHLAVA